LRITEITYNLDNQENKWEWVDIYNAGTEIVNLTGYAIDDNCGAAYSESNIASGNWLSGESAIWFNASAISEADFRQVWCTIDAIPVAHKAVLQFETPKDVTIIRLYDVRGRVVEICGGHQVMPGIIIY